MGVGMFAPIKQMWKRLLEWIARGQQKAPACRG